MVQQLIVQLSSVWGENIAVKTTRQNKWGKSHSFLDLPVCVQLCNYNK